MKKAAPVLVASEKSENIVRSSILGSVGTRSLSGRAVLKVAMRMAEDPRLQTLDSR
jgi:hypothetical protein